VLEAAGIENSEREAAWLLEAAAGTRWWEGELGHGAEPRALALAARRAAGEPLQYLTGVAGFRRLELAVGPGVFIPRPETEVLTQEAMKRLPAGGTIVDVGTGSGAVALSVADERPDARVWATERSGEALEWAMTNRARLGLQVELVACDLLAGLPGSLRSRLDVVVSNPPYVADSETDVLPSEVVDHEPHGALFAADEGRSVQNRLAEQAREWLAPGGYLLMEIGERQAQGVSSRLEAKGYVEIEIIDDLSGRPRVAVGRRPLE
jgi:release factor glutamine methyltransferase